MNADEFKLGFLSAFICVHLWFHPLVYLMTILFNPGSARG